VRWSAALLATFSLAAGAGFVAAVAVYSDDLPSMDELGESYRPRQVNRFYAADGTLIGETYVERRSVVPMSEVPPVVIKAVIGAEDADFFEHQGLDYPGILRALWVNVRSGRKAQGASTITQQVVRTFYLGREKTFSRKFKELLLARRLEQNLSKEEILFLYLNQIYFGHGRYGIAEAARFYFDEDVAGLDLAEAALLAALPKGPELYTPFKDPERAKKRRDLVLSMMASHGLVDDSAAAAARREPVPTEPPERYDPSLGAEFVEEARKTLVALVGERAAELGGYRVTTTMDVRAQKAARAAVEEGLAQLDARRGYRGPVKPRGKGAKKTCREWPPARELAAGQEPVSGRIYAATVIDADDDADALLVSVGDVRGSIDLSREQRYNPRDLPASRFAREGCEVRVSLRPGTRSYGGETVARFALELGPQAQLVAIDPETRHVEAMVGGAGYVRGGFNRALRALRQPGSAFKPFVYLAALRTRRFTPASIVDDAPVRYDEYKPENYETWKFQGPVRLRKALAQSINVVAVRLIDAITPREVATLASSMGIRSELDPVLGLALGGSGVRPVELANAYATMAAGGVTAEPVVVLEVRDPEGRPVALPTRGSSRRVVSEAEAWLLTSMLTSVIEDPAGTGRAARKLMRPAAGKTGTSNRARDAWFAGFTPQLVAVVWVGFDDYKSLGRKESGGRSAVPIWTRFMRDALQGEKKRGFGPPPEGVETALIDPETGLLAWEGQPDAVEERFLEGTVPVERALPPELTTPEEFMMMEGLVAPSDGDADAGGEDGGTASAAPSGGPADPAAPAEAGPTP
jgi:penicillin-binding protein 1A